MSRGARGSREGEAEGYISLLFARFVWSFAQSYEGGRAPYIDSWMGIK